MASKNPCYVGFDLGGTKMRAVVFDKKFRKVAVAKTKTKSGAGEEKGVEQMKQCIDDAMAKAKAAKDDLLGVGFGLPGVLDFKKGRIVRLLNVGWVDVPILDIFREAYGVPVAFDNDVNAGTFGEYKLGSGQGHDNIVGIFPGTGIGGGIIIDGKVHHGVTGGAGELGHLLYDADGPHCGCGNRGCYEAFASRVAIASKAAEAVFRGKAPALKEIAGTDMANIRSGALAKSIAGGDKVIETIVREAAYIVGKLAADMVNALSPSLIVLGGGLVEAMEKIYVEECKRALDNHAVPELRGAVKVVAAQLGDDAVNMGAAALGAEVGKS